MKSSPERSDGASLMNHDEEDHHDVVDAPTTSLLQMKNALFSLFFSLAAGRHGSGTGLQSGRAGAGGTRGQVRRQQSQTVNWRWTPYMWFGDEQLKAEDWRDTHALGKSMYVAVVDKQYRSGEEPPVPCRTPFQIDCDVSLTLKNSINKKSAAGFCPPECPYVQSDKYFKCLISCVAKEECGVLSYATHTLPVGARNPERVYGNNKTMFCEPCPGDTGCHECPEITIKVGGQDDGAGGGSPKVNETSELAGRSSNSSGHEEGKGHDEQGFSPALGSTSHHTASSALLSVLGGDRNITFRQCERCIDGWTMIGPPLNMCVYNVHRSSQVMVVAVLFLLAAVVYFVYSLLKTPKNENHEEHVQAALQHRGRVFYHPQDNPNNFYSWWSTRVHTEFIGGAGFALYFNSLVGLILYAVVCYMIVASLLGGHPSMLFMREIQQKCDSLDSPFLGYRMKWLTQAYSRQSAKVCWVLTFWTILYTVLLECYQRYAERKFLKENANACMPNYVLKLKGFPADATDPSEIQAWLELEILKFLHAGESDEQYVRELLHNRIMLFEGAFADDPQYERVVRDDIPVKICYVSVAYNIFDVEQATGGLLESLLDKHVIVNDCDYGVYPFEHVYGSKHAKIDPAFHADLDPEGARRRVAILNTWAERLKMTRGFDDADLDMADLEALFGEGAQEAANGTGGGGWGASGGAGAGAESENQAGGMTSSTGRDEAADGAGNNALRGWRSSPSCFDFHGHTSRARHSWFRNGRQDVEELRDNLDHAYVPDALDEQIAEQLKLILLFADDVERSDPVLDESMRSARKTVAGLKCCGEAHVVVHSLRDLQNLASLFHQRVKEDDGPSDDSEDEDEVSSSKGSKPKPLMENETNAEDDSMKIGGGPGPGAVTSPSVAMKKRRQSRRSMCKKVCARMRRCIRKLVTVATATKTSSGVYSRRWKRLLTWKDGKSKIRAEQMYDLPTGILWKNLGISVPEFTIRMLFWLSMLLFLFLAIFMLITFYYTDYVYQYLEAFGEDPDMSVGLGSAFILSNLSGLSVVILQALITELTRAMPLSSEDTRVSLELALNTIVILPSIVIYYRATMPPGIITDKESSWTKEFDFGFAYTRVWESGRETSAAKIFLQYQISQLMLMILAVPFLAYDLLHWVLRWIFRTFGSKLSSIRDAEKWLEPPEVAIPSDQGTNVATTFCVGLQLIFMSDDSWKLYLYLVLYSVWCYGYQRLAYLRMSLPLNIATHRVDSAANKQFAAIAGLYGFLAVYWDYRGQVLEETGGGHRAYIWSGDQVGGNLFATPAATLREGVFFGALAAGFLLLALAVVDVFVFATDVADVRDGTTSAEDLQEGDEPISSEQHRAPKNEGGEYYDAVEHLESYSYLNTNPAMVLKSWLGLDSEQFLYARQLGNAHRYADLKYYIPGKEYLYDARLNRGMRVATQYRNNQEHEELFSCCLWLFWPCHNCLWRLLPFSAFLLLFLIVLGIVDATCGAKNGPVEVTESGTRLVHNASRLLISHLAEKTFQVVGLGQGKLGAVGSTILLALLGTFGWYCHDSELQKMKYSGRGGSDGDAARNRQGRIEAAGHLLVGAGVKAGGAAGARPSDKVDQFAATMKQFGRATQYRTRDVGRDSVVEPRVRDRDHK
eukprot:g3672.t1